MFKFINKRGKEVTLLNPSEKGKKYAAELKSKKLITNSGQFKFKNGVVVPLTEKQACFRSGYLQCQKDNAKAYKARQKKNAGVLMLPYSGGSNGSN